MRVRFNDARHSLPMPGGFFEQAGGNTPTRQRAERVFSPIANRNQIKDHPGGGHISTIAETDQGNKDFWQGLKTAVKG